jgi:hypothetical protein
MCSYQEWERLTRRLQEGIDEGPLREFLADAVARVELLVDGVFGPGLTLTELDAWLAAGMVDVSTRRDGALAYFSARRARDLD